MSCVSFVRWSWAGLTISLLARHVVLLLGYNCNFAALTSLNSILLENYKMCYSSFAALLCAVIGLLAERSDIHSYVFSSILKWSEVIFFLFWSLNPFLDNSCQKNKVSGRHCFAIWQIYKSIFQRVVLSRFTSTSSCSSPSSHVSSKPDHRIRRVSLLRHYLSFKSGEEHADKSYSYSICFNRTGLIKRQKGRVLFLER